MRQKGTEKRVWAWLLTAVMIASLLIPCGVLFPAGRRASADETGDEPGSEVMAAYTNNASGTNVRVGPGTATSKMTDKNGNPIQLTPSTIVHVIEKTGNEDTDWSKIRFDYLDEKNLTGYVMNKFLMVFDENLLDPEFEAALDAQGFPESYRKVLRAVHQWNPTWTFKAEILDLDWETVVDAEYNEWPTLTNSNSDYLSSWKSIAQEDYRYAVDDGNGGLKDGGWILKDGRYARASRKMLAYAMDPRNFLAESTIFMFEDLDYNPNVQTQIGVERILSKYDPVATKNERNTFAKEVEGTTHAALFMQAAEQSGVNPYFLATRSVHEVNSSDIMRGNGIKLTDADGNEYVDYVGIYNYYNFGSYATATMGVIQHGLWFASQSSEGQYFDDLRPWNTRAKAIIGGAIRIGNEYVKAGQYTPYYQRFNVNPKKNPDSPLGANRRYGHQYMSLVTALYQESSMYYNGLLEDSATGDETLVSAIETPFVFIIPVYKNMPSVPCARPTGDGNPNPYLASLTVEGYELSTAFSWKTMEYSLTVEEDVETLNITATPLARTTQIVGDGEIKILFGENTYTIRCKAQNGTIVKYNLKIMRKGDGVNPSVTPTPVEEAWVSPTPVPTEVPVSVPPTPTDSPTPTPTPEPEKITSTTYQVTEETISNIEPGTSVTDFLKGITVTGGKASLLNAKGEAVTEGTVGTGWTLKVGKLSIPIIIYGDVTGDGAITALDLLYLKRHILGISKLSGALAVAGDVQNGDGITALDLLYVKRHILEISRIIQKR